jgi:hypothetical protein
MARIACRGVGLDSVPMCGSSTLSEAIPQGSIMARRRSKKSGSGVFGTMVLLIFALAVGVASGYAWRSHAPLPLPTPWGSDDLFAEIKPLTSAPVQTSKPVEPTAFENAEITRLKAELDRLRQDQSATAQDLAEIQIKSVLTEDPQ